MARAGLNHLVTTKSQVIFNHSDGGCTSFMIHCLDGSSSPVLVNIHRMHGSNWIPVRPGRDIVFRMNHSATGGITKVRVKTRTDTARIDYGVVAITDRSDER